MFLFSVLALGSAFGGSATWSPVPTSGDWNTPDNWIPSTVPNGPADVATFDLSSKLAVTISASVEVAGLIFDSGAPSYSITPKPGTVLTLSDTGIANNSSQFHSFTTSIGEGGRMSKIIFSGSATAGSGTTFTNVGGAVPGAETDFLDQSTAGRGTFVNQGGSVPDGGGQTQFFDSSTAGMSVINNLVSQVTFGSGGHTMFFNVSTAGDATITNFGGTGIFLFPGTIFFNDESGAGQSTITNNGGDVIFSSGAAALFEDLSSAENAIITANGGQAAGATTIFMAESTAGEATLIATSAADQSAGGMIIFKSPRAAEWRGSRSLEMVHST